MQMPKGIKVAGPLAVDYGSTPSTSDWVTQPGGKWRMYGGVPVTDETGRMISVLFSSNGTMITRDPTTASGAGMTTWPYLDINGSHQLEPIDHNGYGGIFQYVAYDAVGDEGDLIPCQWLAVYDDAEARKALGDDDWGGVPGDQVRKDEISGWVNGYGVPIHFNRYTGVAEVRRP